MALQLSTLAVAASAAAATFRPPAIPLLTTDPFVQTWARGDNGTSGQVTHWDGAEKQMVGYVRVGGESYQFLGACTPPPVDKPGPATAHTKHNVAPGTCDIANFHGLSESDCNMRCYDTPACRAYVMSHLDNKCFLKSCAAPLTPQGNTDGYVVTGPKPECHASTPAEQLAVTVHPTRTVFELSVAKGAVAVNVTFLSTMFSDDFLRLSRPVYYIDVDVASQDGAKHDVQVYFDASAQHAVNTPDQQVEWKAWASQASAQGGAGPAMRGVQLGNADQKVVGSKGDRVNIDWGYLHLATASSSAQLRAGSANDSRTAFLATGALPATADTRMPRAVSDDLPALALAVDLGSVTAATHTVMLAYVLLSSGGPSHGRLR